MVTSLWKNKVVINTLKTLPVASNFQTYDFVEASNFMIDICDENIIAMYHFTDNDRVMGSIDGAKKLTQTVKNSKYTTRDNEEIGRIHVSLLTSGDKAIDENSYAYELAEMSGGIVYSGASQTKPTPMAMMMTLENNDVKTETTEETNGNLIEILGEGNNGKFTVITSTGLIDSVKLKTVLNDSNGTDTDSDGLYDWDEVNVDIVNRHLKNEGKQELKTINNSDLPLFSDLILHSSEWGSFKPYLWSESDFARYAYANCFDNVRILPILSSPVDADGDNDGIPDYCDKNKLNANDVYLDLNFSVYKRNIDTFRVIKTFITVQNIRLKPNYQINIHTLPKSSSKVLYTYNSSENINICSIIRSNEKIWIKIKDTNSGVCGYIQWNDNFFIDVNTIVSNTINAFGTVGILVSNLGDTYNDDDILSDYIHISNGGKTGIYRTKSYVIVNSNKISVSKSYTLTQYEYDYLVYIVLHEAAGTYVNDPQAQMAAIASTFMNLYESNNSKFSDIMWRSCTQWAVDEYTKNILTSKLKNKDYSGLDFSNFTTESINIAQKAVNTVIYGTRNTSPETIYWYGDGFYNYFESYLP